MIDTLCTFLGLSYAELTAEQLNTVIATCGTLLVAFVTTFIVLTVNIFRKFWK